MNFMQRGWLYITRKKGKTLVMFIILFVMATAIMSGIAIKKAAQTSMQQARESVGGHFTISVDYSENNPNIKRIEEKSEFGPFFSLKNEGPPLSEDITKKLQGVNGLRNINGSRSFGIENNGLTHIEQTKTDTDMSISFIPDGGAKESANLQLNVNQFSQLSAWFENGRMKLLEGRHITNEDTHKVLIHKDFAAKNNLKLGDTFSLKSNPDLTGEKGSGNSVDVEIVGIFEHAKEEKAQVFGPAFMGENNLFTDVETGKQLLGVTTFAFDSIKCNVKDPKQMQSILEEVKTLDIDWKQFAIDANDMQYQQIAGSIEQLDSIVTTILYAIFLVSCIILTLILSLWIKGRIHETGILLSIGITKGNIIMQYCVELLIIAIAAFSLSFLSGRMISQSISDALISSIKTQQQTQMENGMFAASISIDGDIETNVPEEITSLRVDVQYQEVILVYGIGTVLILISVCLSSIPVLRLKPKEILSKMS